MLPLNSKVSFSKTVSAHEEKMMKFYEKFRDKLIKQQRSLFSLPPLFALLPSFGGAMVIIGLFVFLFSDRPLWEAFDSIVFSGNRAVGVIGDGSFVPLFEHFVLFCVVR